MTAILVPRQEAPPRQSRRGRRPDLQAWAIPAAAIAAAAARLPYLGHAPGPDESGFLLVGAQWNGSGASLYGNYFVDRPPLLVTIFRFAAMMGGVPALRVIGCFAVVAVVVGCARVAALVGGPAAGRWSALTAAGLCVSPLLGGYEVNGELLAAPFVVGGILAVVSALRARTSRSGDTWMLAAGALAVCAVLVKQNFADVVVFAAVALIASAIRSDVSLPRFVRMSSFALLGAIAALIVASVWTSAHGTSIRGVYEAMYPFRVRAGRVIASEGQGHAYGRLPGLVRAAVSSGLAILVLLVVADVAKRRRRSAVSWALLAVLVFDGASVLLGGNFWHHYLVGLVVPVSILAGVQASQTRWFSHLAIGYVIAAATLAWTSSLGLPQGSDAQTVGNAVASSADPNDTIVNLYGHADIVQTSGLRSPYQQLWSLPTKTLDPHLTGLDAVLSGPDAPTWLVTGRSVKTWGLQTAATADLIARDYREAATVCDRTIYLRSDTRRRAPRPDTTCRGRHLGALSKESTS